MARKPLENRTKVRNTGIRARLTEGERALIVKAATVSSAAPSTWARGVLLAAAREVLEKKTLI